ncbi:DUF1311 domain-containing protein [Roseomonas terrae]|jgi:uncharacterized protein YecT (DUF1311 family)|uniref:DUF1311 domain-containing protein n=1 Tax=Neoroseomonas terrae TaxID=424799 RepID=A0ABS5EH01_9PROT|nr:lysozyme inhibitor LprI family protein [Neoroseomonas terrae]MBR0650282.1 DUF1311 domain-containing protein [Neoroseomonas terrae]
MRVAAVALALLLPGVAFAQQQRSQAAPRPDDLAQQVERNIRSCVGNAQDMALVARCMDSQRTVVGPRLETAVERLLGTQTNPERRERLAAVQAAWVTYRDMRCDFAGSNPDRGTESAADRAACLLQFDLSRTMEIEQLLAPPSPPAAQQRQQQRR